MNKRKFGYKIIMLSGFEYDHSWECHYFFRRDKIVTRLCLVGNSGMIYTFLIEAAVIAGGFSLGAFRVSISTIKKVNISCRRHETMAIYPKVKEACLIHSPSALKGRVRLGLSGRFQPLDKGGRPALNTGPLHRL